jgi:hypothetical protein
MAQSDTLLPVATYSINDCNALQSGQERMNSVAAEGGPLGWMTG